MEVAVVKQRLGTFCFLRSGRLLSQGREAAVQAFDDRQKQQNRQTEMAGDVHGGADFPGGGERRELLGSIAFEP